MVQLQSGLFLANNYASGCTNWSYQYRAYGVVSAKGNGHIHTGQAPAFAFGLFSGQDENSQLHLFKGGQQAFKGASVKDIGIFIR